MIELSQEQYGKLWVTLLSTPKLAEVRCKLSVYELRILVCAILETDPPYGKLWEDPISRRPQLSSIRKTLLVSELRAVADIVVSVSRNHSPQKLSELIHQLVQIERKHGDLEIVGPTDDYLMDFIPLDEDDMRAKYSGKSAVSLLIEFSNLQE